MRIPIHPDPRAPQNLNLQKTAFDDEMRAQDQKMNTALLGVSVASLVVIAGAFVLASS